MKLIDLFRGKRPGRVAGRISDDPRVIDENGARYLVFHVTEVTDVEFRLRMSPMTPQRQQGDLVEVSYSLADGIAIVESLIALPDEEAARKRRMDYLARIREQNKGREN